jgi:hypothetical protein
MDGSNLIPPRVDRDKAPKRADIRTLVNALAVRLQQYLLHA